MGFQSHLGKSEASLPNVEIFKKGFKLLACGFEH